MTEHIGAAPYQRTEDRKGQRNGYSEFRSRLLEGDSERLLFDHLLERFRGMGLIKARGKQRTDSTRILAVVRGLLNLRQ
jgi:hypothetical protein